MSQSVAIRRLLDKYPIEGDRGVYSLRAALDSMLSNRLLLTRGNMLDAEMLKFDYSEVRRSCDSYERDQLAQGVRAYFIPKELDWSKHERRHEELDLLTGVNKDERAHEDVVRESVIMALLNRLQVADNVQRHVDKFVAHAATPESRSTIDPADLKVTLGHLWTAHKAIAEVCGFVSIYLLGGPQLAFLATPQFDQFQYFDRPLAKNADLPRLQKVWDDYATDTENWGTLKLEDLESDDAGKAGLL